MQVITTIEELEKTARKIRQSGKTIGLVPTMGALHAGHLSLIHKARAENDAVICSIFVNPVQFNNPEDLRKYPRTLQQDVEAIGKDADCVFAPSVEEIFPVPPAEQYHYGLIEEVMEGAVRPGHFNGVGVIVGRLLKWTLPDRAYFGEKDYQQIAIVRELVRQIQVPTEIVACPIVREPSGLALSSRNRLLSPEELQIASRIRQILLKSQNLQDVPQIKEFVITEIAKVPQFKLDYFEIADDKTLQPVNSLEDAAGIMGFVAVYVGNVRLIDNIRYR